ncbi:hypothetical protein TURU_085588 [Turdus rufiventris]|nr:hypothetical protein TURU_085588 [Turdus rufiventris]
MPSQRWHETGYSHEGGLQQWEQKLASPLADTPLVVKIRIKSEFSEKEYSVDLYFNHDPLFHLDYFLF